MDQSSEAMNTTSDRDKEELSPKSKKEEEEQIDSFLRRKINFRDFKDFKLGNSDLIQ